MVRIPGPGTWNGHQNVASRMYLCGYCNNKVASHIGWEFVQGGGPTIAGIRICPQCSGPTFFASQQQMPEGLLGEPVGALPPDVSKVYEEARSALAAGAPTAAVLCLRKLLMHVAVEKGAPPGGTFQKYVEYLSEHHHVPAGAEEWIDQIRRQSNEANHELTVKSGDEAKSLLEFSEMLLKLAYEFPARARARSSKP